MGLIEQGGSFKPRPFQEKFDAGSQGGNSLGGESSAKEGLRRAAAVVGQRMTECIDAIDYKKLTEIETAKARYYRYSLAVSLREMGKEEFLPENPVHREDELVYMEVGAREAALEYLEDVPDSKVAQTVGLLGMQASDKVHQRLFYQGLGRNILQFIKKYNPNLERKEAS